MRGVSAEPNHTIRQGDSEPWLFSGKIEATVARPPGPNRRHEATRTPRVKNSATSGSTRMNFNCV